MKQKSHSEQVTPFVGVWIETALDALNDFNKTVTPFVGVWIETFWAMPKGRPPVSHPSWVCGLKLCAYASTLSSVCHTLRGCVD